MGDQYSRAPLPYGGMKPAKLKSGTQSVEAIEPDRLPQYSEQAALQVAADLETYHPMVRRRDQFLETAAAAANILLTLENFDEAINTALKIIVEGAGCDRINVLEGSPVDSSLEHAATVPDYHTVIYEWTGPGIIQQMATLEAGRIPSAGIEAFLERYYLHGDGFGGLLEEWIEPLRSAYAAVQVQSSYSVPIRAKGQWWGVLCLNYCREAIRISPAEVAVLRTIADCIGRAIQRDRSQQEREQIARQRAEDLEAYNRNRPWQHSLRCRPTIRLEWTDRRV